jgi:hypothetical protein
VRAAATRYSSTLYTPTDRPPLECSGIIELGVAALHVRGDTGPIAQVGGISSQATALYSDADEKAP